MTEFFTLTTSPTSLTICLLISVTFSGSCQMGLYIGLLNLASFMKVGFIRSVESFVMPTLNEYFSTVSLIFLTNH